MKNSLILSGLVALFLHSSGWAFDNAQARLSAVEDTVLSLLKARGVIKPVASVQESTFDDKIEITIPFVHKKLTSDFERELKKAIVSTTRVPKNQFRIKLVDLSPKDGKAVVRIISPQTSKVTGFVYVDTSHKHLDQIGVEGKALKIKSRKKNLLRYDVVRNIKGETSAVLIHVPEGIQVSVGEKQKIKSDGSLQIRVTQKKTPQVYMSAEALRMNSEKLKFEKKKFNRIMALSNSTDRFRVYLNGKRNRFERSQKYTSLSALIRP